jgi:hypothetical protein
MTRPLASNKNAGIDKPMEVLLFIANIYSYPFLIMYCFSFFISASRYTVCQVIFLLQVGNKKCLNGNLNSNFHPALLLYLLHYHPSFAIGITRKAPSVRSVLNETSFH